MYIISLVLVADLIDIILDLVLVSENLVSPSRTNLTHFHTQAESGAYLRDVSRFQRRRPFIYLNSHTRLGQSRVYRVTQLRTDGVHCRESIGTGPVNLKVVLNGCCLGMYVWSSHI